MNRQLDDIGSSALSNGFSSELSCDYFLLDGQNSFQIHSLLQLDCSMKSSRRVLGSNCLRSFISPFNFLLRLFHCYSCYPVGCGLLPFPRLSLFLLIQPITSSLYLVRFNFSRQLYSQDLLFYQIHLSWQLLDFSCSELFRRLLEFEDCWDWLKGVEYWSYLGSEESGWNRSEIMDYAAKALIQWLGSFTSLSVACWKSSLYFLITRVFIALFHALCITTTFLVSSSSEIWLLFMMALTTSSCEFILLVKMGTSSDMVLSIRTSMLLRYSLKVFEWDSKHRLQLVIGLLPPNSEAKRLMLSNFETTLSFLAKEVCDCALRFLMPVVQESSNGCFLGLIKMNEFTWPFLRDFVVLVVPIFFAEIPTFCCAGWMLLECGFTFLTVPR